MAEPYLSEIRIMGFNFAPRNWAQCNGQILPINQNQSLYSLLGTMYGGDGRTTFALPDLRGRTPVRFDSTYPEGIAGQGGTMAQTLTVNQMPAHNHTLVGTTGGDNAGEPDGTSLKGEGQNNEYAAPDATKTVDMDARSLSNQGSGEGHENMQPYLGLNFCIAIRGLFPSRN